MDENMGFMAPLIFEDTAPIPTVDFVIEYLNTLEGFKTKIKNLHWSAVNLSIHEQLDALLDEVNSFQDNIAEEYMGIKGQVGPNDLTGTIYNYTDPILMLEELKNKTISFHSKLKLDPQYVGIQSETETFIHCLNQRLYLFRICK